MVTTSERNSSIPPTFADGWKRVFLGAPLTTEQLESERLSNPVALGALSPDAISSTAYGPEQIMVELLPNVGMAAFLLLLPIIGVILFILLLVSASYRGVVTTYTRTGGAYMVARDNFGPRIAQIAAAALLIDYVVTCAVQPAAGTVAVVSAIHQLRPYHLEITIGVLVFIDSVDLAEVEAIRYAKGLEADELTAIHFVLDSAHAAQLQQQWEYFDNASDLRVIDCLDRNLGRAAQELVQQTIDEHDDTKVTVLLPRREYSQLLGRLLHDRTADKIARVVSRIPGASAQIVAYDIATRIAQATAVGDGSPSRVSGANDRIELPGLDRAHAEDLTPQAVDFGGK